MKLALRFALTAVTLAVAVTMISCTAQSPTAPSPNNQSLERGGVGPTRPPVDGHDSDPIKCDLTLGAPASEILSNAIPFNLSCENMGKAVMTIGHTSYNRNGCLTVVLGWVEFSDTHHTYQFEMHISNTSPGCTPDGGYIIVYSPLLGGGRLLRLPGLTSIGSGTVMTAN